MSNQSQVFTQFRALFGTDAIPPFEDPKLREIDNLDFVDFLIELVKQTKGQKAFKNIILRGVLGDLNGNDAIGTQILKILKEKFYCDYDFIILKKFTTKSSNGIFMNTGEIDINDLFSIDPESREGALLYEGSDPTVHLNRALYDATTATDSNPVVWSYDSRTLFTIHSTGVNELVFKFGADYDGKLFSEWAEDFFNTVEFFNLPNFMSTLVNLVTGSISLRAGKTSEGMRSEGILVRSLKKMFGFCNETDDNDAVKNNGQKFIEDHEQTGFSNLGLDENGVSNEFDEVFNLSDSELLDLDKEVSQRVNGELRFATCGDVLVPVNHDDIFNRLESLFSNDVDTIGFDNSLATTNIGNALDVFDQSLKDGVKQLVDDGEDEIQVNLPNMQMELETGLLKLIPYALMLMIASPKLLLFVKVAMVLSGNENTLTTKEVIKTIGSVISNIGKEITKAILENIADVVKNELTKLAKGIAQKYLAKRFEDFQAVLGFLSEIIRLAKGLIDAIRDRSVCQSLLSSLSKIMSLSYMGPAPMIPFPLALIGGALKSGLSDIQVIQDLKSDLQRKGIETSPYFSDGTPNYMMYALESLTSTIIKHIKMNARIDVGGMAGPIPVQAFGQIT